MLVTATEGLPAHRPRGPRAPRSALGRPRGCRSCAQGVLARGALLRPPSVTGPRRLVGRRPCSEMLGRRPVRPRPVALVSRRAEAVQRGGAPASRVCRRPCSTVFSPCPAGSATGESTYSTPGTWGHSSPHCSVRTRLITGRPPLRTQAKTTCGRRIPDFDEGADDAGQRLAAGDAEDADGDRSSTS